jgi:hypothetical protein
MNYGPLEFADYLRRTGRRDSAAVQAARAAQPASASPANQLRIISGTGRLTAPRPAVPPESVRVYEAVAMNPPSAPRAPGAVRVALRYTAQPVALVLSSHQPVEWWLALAPDVQLTAVLLSGWGNSTVEGVAAGTVHRIGGFYAFKRGSLEYRHLESELLRCTGRVIAHFETVYAGANFDIG